MLQKLELDIDFNKVDRKNDLIKSIEQNNKLIILKKPWKINLHKIKVKNLKTQENVRLTFTIGIDAENLSVKLPNEKHCDHKFRLFNTGLMAWEWRLVWQCINCGFLCYCSCFEEAIKYADKKENNNRRMEKFKKEKGIDISSLPYYPNACEVCRDKPSTHKYCHDMYARSEFEKRYGAYVKKKYYELKSNNSEPPNDFDLEKYANNLIREKLGFKKIGEQYVTETELYRIVNSIFKEIKVIHHYRGDWLKGQELDIYIPKKKLGIEYQGKQHFEAIKVWGGKEALQNNKKRDKRKKEKCENQGVELIEFTYKEKDKLSESYVLNKINKFLK